MGFACAVIAAGLTRGCGVLIAGTPQGGTSPQLEAPRDKETTR